MYTDPKKGPGAQSGSASKRICRSIQEYIYIYIHTHTYIHTYHIHISIDIHIYMYIFGLGSLSVWYFDTR